MRTRTPIRSRAEGTVREYTHPTNNLIPSLSLMHPDIFAVVLYSFFLDKAIQTKITYENAPLGLILLSARCAI